MSSSAVVGEPTSPTTTPPLSSPPPPPKVFETPADVDSYIKWVKEQQRHRGAGSSRDELKCPIGGCGKPQRRPGVLRDHILSVHLGLRTYKCPQAKCPEWFPTDSNRKRHLKTCPFRNE
ncbi:hypothetical protein FRC12_022200 [Ceratobasidium sp. 428]|nr:hypothetical protein FRC12_022200 [Ceratobasidium sp. 428]